MCLELRTNVALSILDGLEMFSNFYSRIPDSVVLEHRSVLTWCLRILDSAVCSWARY